MTSRKSLLSALSPMRSHRVRWLIPALCLSAGLAAAAWAGALALPRPAPVEQVSPMHPAVTLLDQDGQNVLESGAPISTMQTCGSCHDAGFIAQHSSHANLGYQDLVPPGELDGARSWETGPGFFGSWNPFLYRTLSAASSPAPDLTTPGWIMLYGPYHAGGGPAQFAPDGRSLAELPPGSSLEASYVDPQTGELLPWDWQASGVVEMNCFLCHTPNPDNHSRTAALQSGRFGWANTATLLLSGIVETAGAELRYNPAAFTATGELVQGWLKIQDPTDQNCAQCHTQAPKDAAQPLAVTGCSLEDWTAGATGLVFSPQRISDSGANLAGKQSLTRSWDVHAERLVQCADCHHAQNNPAYAEKSSQQTPAHLSFDPRRIEIGEYINRPMHVFALAPSQPDQEGGQACASCHDIQGTHSWLPYKDRHFNTLSCETCHIPKVYTPAFQQVDWTVLKMDGSPVFDCRGVQGENLSPTALISGYQPVLLPRQYADGSTRLAPANLVSAWYWVAGDPPAPVALSDLQAVWLEQGAYAPEILAAFDQDGSRQVEEHELLLDTPAKVELIAARLARRGLDNPRITGEVLTYNLHHGIAPAEWSTRDCRACHGDDSRLAQPIQAAAYLPGGQMPGGPASPGGLYLAEQGALFLSVDTADLGLYVLGHNRTAWVDLLGALAFSGVLLGVAAHGSLRFYAALRRPRHTPRLKRVYMYAVYERFWHWLQTFVILGLIFTGLVIHRPDTFGIFRFDHVVLVHNVLAGLLVLNAALSLFYHLASGEIQQYIPRPAGFFDQAIQQGIFYLRGIFTGEKHPFEKTPGKKLNPLQQVTYLTILNVLLPLQILTGALMWGVQRWPELTSRLGGLPFLGPFHSLIAWLFAAFVVMHVYLTTTGHTPLAGIEAMVGGWDELEVHEPMTIEEEPV